MLIIKFFLTGDYRMSPKFIVIVSPLHVGSIEYLHKERFSYYDMCFRTRSIRFYLGITLLYRNRHSLKC